MLRVVAAFIILSLLCAPVAADTRCDAKVEIVPDSLKLLWRYAIVPIMASIYLGEITHGHAVSSVDPATLTINDVITPVGTTMLPSYPGFDGEVMEITVSLTDFIAWYELLWDTTVQSFTVKGSFTNSADIFSGTNDAVFFGHASGDANGDGVVTVSDAVFITNYTFRGGPGPALYDAGDANGDGEVNIADAVYLLTYIFRNGPRPTHP